MNSYHQNISLILHEDMISQKVISTSQNVIASLGMITNLVVVVVFIYHKEFRQKHSKYIYHLSVK